MSKNDIVIGVNGNAFLKGAQAAVTITNKNIFANPDADPLELFDDKYRGVVPWGEDNDLPEKIQAEIEKSPVASRGLLFNIELAYGQGLKPVIFDKEDKTKYKTVDNAEIIKFFEDNDIDLYILEQLTDLFHFYNCFPEIILNNESNPKIVELSSKEAYFSRYEEMNDKGIIEHHFYSAQWSGDKEQADDENTDFTPVLNARKPLKDLRNRVENNPADKTGNKNKRFIIPINFPSPGKFYYQKAPWYSIIESGWLEFAGQIPDFKKSLMQNQMVIKYHVELSEEYFPTIFAAENITEDKARKDRIKKEYKAINDYLTDTKNAGKAVISYTKKFPGQKGMEIEKMMKITPIENNIKGGEFIEDSEEVSNIILFALGVHPGIIGASLGKNKSISGTEARELFTIKQAMLKPIRDRILKPLYLIRDFNGWPKEIDFIIPDLVLTTLDKEPTGKKEVINKQQ